MLEYNALVKIYGTDCELDGLLCRVVGVHYLGISFSCIITYIICKEDNTLFANGYSCMVLTGDCLKEI